MAAMATSRKWGSLLDKEFPLSHNSVILLNY